MQFFVKLKSFFRFKIAHQFSAFLRKVGDFCFDAKVTKFFDRAKRKGVILAEHF